MGSSSDDPRPVRNQKRSTVSRLSSSYGSVASLSSVSYCTVSLSPDSSFSGNMGALELEAPPVCVGALLSIVFIVAGLAFAFALPLAAVGVVLLGERVRVLSSDLVGDLGFVGADAVLGVGTFVGAGAVLGLGLEPCSGSRWMLLER